MLRSLLAALALACALAFSSPVLADPACDGQFLDGRRPVIMNAEPGATELCSDAFVTLWSPVTRDPVYSAEHLTPEGLTKADHEARDNGFHADVRLPKDVRAELSDYEGGAYDRGHLAPAADMPTPTAMHESFALSNMSPQVPSVNRGAWAHVEIFTRRLAILGGEAHVVTLLAFDANPKRLNERVAIPASYIKAVRVPPSMFNPDGQVGAYAMANVEGAKAEIISLDEVIRRTGRDPFPSLSVADHARADLPTVAGK